MNVLITNELIKHGTKTDFEILMNIMLFTKSKQKNSSMSGG